MAPAGDFAVGAQHRFIDHLLIYAGLADGGLLTHDDLIAGQGHQHRMSFDRLGKIGHGRGGVQFFAGEEIGQLMGVIERAAATGLGAIAGNVELEYQHRPGAGLPCPI